MSRTIQIETKYAILKYEDTDNCLIEELATYLNEETEIVFNFFKIKAPNQKLLIKIIPTKEQYDKEFLRRHNNFSKDFIIPKSARGEYFEKDNTIYYLSIADYKNTSHTYNETKLAIEDYKKTLVHEFVHYSNKLFNIQNNNGWTSKYLVEGIATYLSKQKENKNISFNFTLEELLETDMRKSCYDGYYLIAKYLIENYSKDFVLDLFTSSNQSKRFLENELYDKAKQYYTEKMI